MGFGLVLIPALALVYVPIFLWSLSFYRKSKALSEQETNDFSSSALLKRTILFFYVIAAFCNENFGDIIYDILYYTVLDPDPRLFEYWLKQDLKRAFFGWDDLYDISNYWAAILVAFVVGIAFAYLVEIFSVNRLYKYNVYVLAFFNMLLHPFIIFSFVGRLARWEPIVNDYLGL